MNETVVMRNRACSGTRVVSENEHIIKRESENVGLIFTISYHYVEEKYMVEEQYRYLDRKAKPCYGRIVFWGETPEECVKYIEEVYNVSVKLLNPLVLLSASDLKKINRS